MGATTTGPQQGSLLRSELARDVLVGLLSGLTVALVITVITEIREDRRVARSERLENLRFVRSLSGPDTSTERQFGGLDLVGMPMTGLGLSDSRLDGADLHEALLDGTDLSGSSLRGVNAAEAHIVSADLSEIDATCTVFDDETGPECTDLSEAILAGSDLSGADLSGADLRETDLTNTVLDGIRYDCDATTSWPEGFDPPASATCPS